MPRPDRFTPWERPGYPLYRRLGGPQGQSGWVRKISPPLGFDLRTVQPVGSRYTDYATWLFGIYNVISKKYIYIRKTFSETRAVCQCGKIQYSQTGHRWKYNTAHALCIPDKWGKNRDMRSKYLIYITFPRQKWLRERPSMWHHTNPVYPV